jgi:hypothetical protein
MAKPRAMRQMHGQTTAWLDPAAVDRGIQILAMPTKVLVALAEPKKDDDRISCG